MTPILGDYPAFRRLAVSGLVFALLACVDGTDVTSTDEKPAADSSLGGSPGCSNVEVDAGQYDPFAPNEWPGPGVVHLTEVGDAMNASLDADGAIRLFVFGCDFWRCSSGLWAIDGTDIVVTPRAGELEMGWPGTAGANLVRMSLVAPGFIRAVVAGSAPTQTQTWQFGRICANCCADRGPSTLYACPGAVEGHCDDQ